MRKQQVAVIGGGNWGRNHIRVFYHNNTLVGVADTDSNLRLEIKENYPGVHVFSDFNDVLIDPGIDAVVVATPSPTHFEITKAALLAGKDVLVEKPMAINANEAAELVEIADRNKRVLMVGHLLLYKAAVVKIIKRVREGVIGQLQYISMRRLKLGRVRKQENVLWSFATHDAAVLLELVDSPVESITANGLRAIQPQIEDGMHVHVVFENKIQAHIHTSWLWPEDERKTTLIGTGGMITYDEHEDKIWLHRKGVSGDLNAWDRGKEEIPVEQSDALEEEAFHFLHCIENRVLPHSCGRKGLAVVKFLVDATNSCKTGSVDKNIFIHPSAYVDEPVKIGPQTQVWHFSHIMSGADLGAGCKIGQNVFIGKGVMIGNNVKIQNNVSIYQGVILEDDVFCGPSMVFTNIKTPRSAYPRNTSEQYLVTRVKRGASIGANATIVCGITIGKHTLIGAGAVVTKDIPDYAVVYGNPGTIKGWTCRCGDVITESIQEDVKCDTCQIQLKSGRVEK